MWEGHVSEHQPLPILSTLPSFFPGEDELGTSESLWLLLASFYILPRVCQSFPIQLYLGESGQVAPQPLSAPMAF